MTPPPGGPAPVLERFRLDGRRALVTGAGRGIGRGFAQALAEAGARVAVVDLDGGRATAVTRELEQRGFAALSIRCDVTADGAGDEVVRQVVEAWGGLEIAVNNAGINFNSAAEETERADWDTQFDVNVGAVMRGCQAQGRVMLSAGYGKIINTASMASLIVPHPQKQAGYNASKHAVVGLTRSLAAEWADRGVRVNCISPGIIRTPLIEDSLELRPLMDGWVRQIPAGRLGEVEDLQGAIVYLASPASDYMTGHNLVIEGGQSLW